MPSAIAFGAEGAVPGLFDGIVNGYKTYNNDRVDEKSQDAFGETKKNFVNALSPDMQNTVSPFIKNATSMSDIKNLKEDVFPLLGDLNQSAHNTQYVNDDDERYNSGLYYSPDKQNSQIDSYGRLVIDASKQGTVGKFIKDRTHSNSATKPNPPQDTNTNPYETTTTSMGSGNLPLVQLSCILS